MPTDPLTEADIAAMEERVSGASPGPWHACADNVGQQRVSGKTYIYAETHNVWLQKREVDANTEFIAHSRDDIPRLIAEVRRLREENAALRPRPQFGSGKGTVTMAEDFDAPLEEFKEYEG